MPEDRWDVRRATVADADDVARLLFDFNTEFDTPTPEPAVLGARLIGLLGSDSTFAVIAGTPPFALALVTLRPNVWYGGRVALLDEMYVRSDLRSQGIGTAVMAEMLSIARSEGADLIEINVDEGDVDAQRFYERQGYSSTEPTTNERAFYFFRELVAEQ